MLETRPLITDLRGHQATVPARASDVFSTFRGANFWGERAAVTWAPVAEQPQMSKRADVMNKHSVGSLRAWLGHHGQLSPVYNSLRANQALSLEACKDLWS